MFEVDGLNSSKLGAVTGAITVITPSQAPFLSRAPISDRVSGYEKAPQMLALSGRRVGAE